MKRLQIILVALAVATVFASCCPCRKASNKNHKPLNATEWVLVQMDGRNISEQFKAESNGSPRIVFGEDNSFGGFGGCNSMGGKYSLTPSEAPSQKNIAGKIVMSDIMSTKRYCPNDQVEMALFQALSEVDAYTIDGNKLLLLKDGELKLVFEAK